MKKIDYYAVQNPWRMPKWVGIMLGGVFGVIAIGSMITIVQLTRPPAAPAPVAALAAAPMAQASAAAPVADTTSDVKATAPVASAEPAAPAGKHASKRHASAHGKKAKARMLASAKRSPGGLDAAQRQTILAKHDTKSKRIEKDALDKLLGL